MPPNGGKLQTIICNTINMEQYTETQQELTLNDIKEIEKEFGVDIPQDMKAHYLQNNGGFPPYNRIKADKHILSIDGFIPLKYGICNISKLSADYQKSGLLFANMLPFANDEGGNIYLIDLDHNRLYGSIYLWFYESDDTYIDNMLYVCDSFAHFISSMFEDY